MSPLFLAFVLIFIAAAVVSILSRQLKVPDTVGFIALGVAWSALSQTHLHSFTASFEPFASLGLMFLLFLVGLELPIASILKHLRSVHAAVLHVALMTVWGGLLLWISSVAPSYTTAAFVALLLSFSSTVMVLRSLSERGELKSVTGQVSTMMLLTQDVIAVVLFGLVSQTGTVIEVLGHFGVGTVVVFLLYGVSTRFLPSVLRHIGADGERLFLFGTAWCLGVAALLSSPWIGTSLELGGFVAGVLLSHTSQHLQVAARLRSVRDLFMVLFYVYLGTTLQLTSLGGLFPLIIMSLVLLCVVKPLSLVLTTSLFHYPRRVSARLILLLFPVSEFSLILASAGVRSEVLPASVLPTLTVVAVISFLVSALAAQKRNGVLSVLESLLPHTSFATVSTARARRFKQHAVLIGFGRKGHELYAALVQKFPAVVVIDADPENTLPEPWVQGDCTEEEIQEAACMHDAALIISTMMNLRDDVQLVSDIRAHSTTLPVIVTAKTKEEADALYAAGASYVLLPQYVAGLYLADSLRTLRSPMATVGRLRKAQKSLFGAMG